MRGEIPHVTLKALILKSEKFFKCKNIYNVIVHIFYSLYMDYPASFTRYTLYNINM